MSFQSKYFGWQQSLDGWFKKQFYRLGVCIAERPGYFIIIPILISLLLGTGLQQLQYENDPSYIFTPRNGKAKSERETAEKLFLMDYDGGFDPSRFHRPGRFARLIVTAKDNGTLFRRDIWDEIRKLDRLVKDIRIIHDEIQYSFEELCARWKEGCYQNGVLGLGEHMDQIEMGNLSLIYPITFLDGKIYPLAMWFGGLKIRSKIICKAAKAVQLIYFLDPDSPKKDERGGIWEKKLLEELDKAEIEGRWRFIKVDRFTQRSLPDQVNSNVMSVIPFATIAGPLMVIFGIVSCMMGLDWVRSKPWLGIAGVVTPTLGSLGAFGLLCYFRIPTIGINVAAPFLVMGLGMDDAFVVLAAWRQTSVHDPVPKRLGQAYAEAGVSITITSLTDFLSFVIGILSPFESIQIFSAYTAVSVLFTYIVHIFFFGGAMALSGYHEAQNRHSLFWWLNAIPLSKFLEKTPSTSESPINSPPIKKSRFQRLFFRGGSDPNDPDNPVNIQENGIMIFFRDRWASLFLNPYVKALIFLLVALYWGISGWGITRMEEGMEMKRIASDGYLRSYYDVNKELFHEFPQRIQVIVSSGAKFETHDQVLNYTLSSENPSQNGAHFLNYSDPNVQNRIESLMHQLENTRFTKGGSLYSESWLRSFLSYVQDTNITNTIRTESEFIRNLEIFLKLPSSGVYNLDVKFSEDRNRIIASRFIIQTVNLTDWKDQRDMLITLRSIAEAEAPYLNVAVFDALFMFLDQFLVIRSCTIQLVGIASGVMMVVSIIFIPSLICSLWVALAVLSIEAGVLGFLSWWHVNLDVLSMIYLVMSVGFSVDFSAHICYAFMSNTKARSAEERLRTALYSLGLPIVQGSFSTILGVMVLIFATAYDFVAFFKAVFLVMVIAIAHGLLLLPTLLMSFGVKDEVAPKLNESRKTNELCNGVIEMSLKNGQINNAFTECDVVCRIGDRM